MKKIINKLSKDVEVYTKCIIANSDNRYYISNYGFVVASDDEKGISDKIISRHTTVKVISDFKEDKSSMTLTLSAIKTREDDETITFFEEPFVIATFNKKYRELSQQILNADDFEEFEEDESAIESKIVNIVLYDRFCHAMLSGEEKYEELMTFCRNINSKSIYKFYLNGCQKSLSLYVDIEEAHFDLKTSLSTGEPIDYTPTKKVIKLLRDYRADLNEIRMGDISLKTLCKLIRKYSFDEVEKLMVVSKKMQFVYDNFWNKLLLIDNISLTDIVNYLIKNVIVGSFYESGELRCNMNLFLCKYIDYLGIKKEEDDNFPESLSAAHDQAIEDYNERRRREDAELREKLIAKQKAENEQLEKDFQKAVKKYEDFTWEKDEFSIEVPKTTTDLDDESDAMHNCVRGYKKRVAYKVCQVCFMRKEGKAYITIEVNMDGEIVQAKKFANNLPDEDDLKILGLWANEKGLTIKRL